MPLWALAQTAADIDFITSWRARSYVNDLFRPGFTDLRKPVISLKCYNNKLVTLSNQIINWVVDNAPFGRAWAPKHNFPADPLKRASTL